jgi:hypothetical protein
MCSDKAMPAFTMGYHSSSMVRSSSKIRAFGLQDGPEMGPKMGTDAW